jgi:hypothetical protein
MANLCLYGRGGRVWTSCPQSSVLIKLRYAAVALSVFRRVKINLGNEISLLVCKHGSINLHKEYLLKWEFL